MANDVTRNPWVLDTANPVPSVASSVWPVNSPIYCLHVEFSGYALNTDKAVLTDADGVEIATLQGAGDLQEVRTGIGGWLHRGLCLVTLTAAASRVKVFIK